MPKYKSRGFSVSPDDLLMLEDIKERKGYGTTSEALRFCIKQTHKNILSAAGDLDDNNAPEVMTKLDDISNTLRYTLYEIIKVNEGREASKDAIEYFREVLDRINKHEDAG